MGLSSDGRLLASGGVRDESIPLFDTKTGRLLRTLSGAGRGVHSLEFSASGRRLLSVGSGEKLYTTRLTLWSVGTGKRIRHIDTFVGSVAVLSHDGMRVAFSDGNKVKVWKTEE